MAREVDGWEHTKNGPRWAPTTGVQVADMLCGLYGDEYDEAKREIDDLIRAVQRDCAEKIRQAQPEVPEEFTTPHRRYAWRQGRIYAADLIMPIYPGDEDATG
ncbi:hypothetical protein [Streptodolium elevatio]|uniref:Uncharacterized protein n=1 Tax=Streptodolium elevatio TaxID=3157996 RepID=A0ABV3DBZ4_9ACTN